ncbi:MAG: amino acid ABC transporter permease [Lacisediminihabitans sp.]
MDYILESVLRLLPGLWLSIQMAVVSLAFGLPLGFIAGLLLNSRSKAVRYPVIGLVEIFRGFPALLTLYLVYFGLMNLILLDRFTTVVVAFSVTSGAYSAEIFRAAITSVPRGQLEAAASLAIRRSKIVLLVVIPHVLRVAVPPIIGIAIITFQGTALAYAIGAKELLGTAFSWGIRTFVMVPELTVAAALYLIVTSALSWMEVLAERRAQRITGTASSRLNINDKRAALST